MDRMVLSEWNSETVSHAAKRNIVNNLSQSVVKNTNVYQTKSSSRAIRFNRVRTCSTYPSLPAIAAACWRPGGLKGNNLPQQMWGLLWQWTSHFCWLVFYLNDGHINGFGRRIIYYPLLMILQSHQVQSYTNMFVYIYIYVCVCVCMHVHIYVYLSIYAWHLPSGKQPHNYGTSPCLLDKSTISTDIFNI